MPSSLHSYIYLSSPQSFYSHLTNITSAIRAEKSVVFMFSCVWYWKLMNKFIIPRYLRCKCFGFVALSPYARTVHHIAIKEL